MSQAVSVVVPVLDEQGNLKPLHAAICQALDQAEIVFECIYVDDGSTDNSSAELRDLAAEDPRVRVIRFVRNYGQTAALTAGIRHAQHPLLVTLDADMQNDPADIPAMIERLNQGYDVVCGWRKDRKDAIFTRTLPSKVANALISYLSKVHLHDYGCTLRVYKREFIKGIPLYGEMHRFIPIYVTWAGARLVEMPVRHHARTIGKSKYGLGRIPKVLLDLTTVKFLRDFYVTPIYFFGWTGFGFFGLGLLTFGAAAAFALGQSFELGVLLAAIATLMVMLGTVEITLGIIAEVLIRMHHDVRDRPPYRIQHVRNLQTDEEVVAPVEP